MPRINELTATLARAVYPAISDVPGEDESHDTRELYRRETCAQCGDPFERRKMRKGEDGEWRCIRCTCDTCGGHEFVELIGMNYEAGREESMEVCAGCGEER